MKYYRIQLYENFFCDERAGGVTAKDEFTCLAEATAFQYASSFLCLNTSGMAYDKVIIFLWIVVCEQFWNILPAQSWADLKEGSNNAI